MSLVRRRIAIVLTTILLGLAVRQAASSEEEAGELRTPRPPDTPQVHGPKAYGARPGHSFLYRIPCTGNRPITFSAENLPASLTLDAKSGIISGQAPERVGEYPVQLKATNAISSDTRPFKIIVGNTIGLTPQMGWNDWYTFYDRITEGDVRKAAAAMISSGMADFGYQYVDIDDCWARKPGSKDPALMEAVRDEQGRILPNARFPDMQALTEYIHGLGLKAGIYTSPGPLTCGKFEGTYQHEDADAHQFAQWGFDLLKYDWCSYGQIAKDKSLAAMQEPYKKMGNIVVGLDRDVVLNMCQYGMGDVWNWGRQVGGNSWRTTGDLGLVPNRSLPGFYSIGFANATHSEFAGPGGWNDPDYILIGMVGNAHHRESAAQHTPLTAQEQYSYMSMWSLMAAPLIFSGDLSELDEFTRNVLCNAEVIDIDQDSLGKQAKITIKTNKEFVLSKPLDDGSLAVGLFNLTAKTRRITVNWNDLGVNGKQMIRDVWRQQNMGSFATSFSSKVSPHGVILVRAIPSQSQ